MRYLLLAAATGCVSFAAPPPMVTFDGPATAGRDRYELGIGAGTGTSIFPGHHGPGQAWFGRVRYGVSDTVDVGVDVIGVERGDKQTVTGKLAARWNPVPWLRLEGGAGGADDSDGKALNGDAAVIAGTPCDHGLWRFYGGVRAAAAFGFPGDVVGSGTTSPPNAYLAIATVGTSARLSDHARFVIEGGYGALDVKGQTGVGMAHYFGVGVVFHVGK